LKAAGTHHRARRRDAQSREKSGKVIQVGTQNRSNSLYQQAKEMVEQGMIGDVHYVGPFGIAIHWTIILHGATRFPTMQVRRIPIGLSFLGPAPRRTLTRIAIISGVSIGIIPAESQLTCWSTRRTSAISFAAKWFNLVHASGGIYRWTGPTDGPRCA